MDYLEDHTILYQAITDLYTTKHRVRCQQDCGLDVTKAHESLSFSLPTERGIPPHVGAAKPAGWVPIPMGRRTNCLKPRDHITETARFADIPAQKGMTGR